MVSSLRDLGLADAVRYVGQAGIAGHGQQRPDQNVAAHAGKKPGSCDHQNQQGNCRGAAGHGVGVQLQQFAVEGEGARTLRQAVARPAHRARDVAVAVPLGAVHNELVGRCQSAATPLKVFNLCEQPVQAPSYVRND